MVAQRLTQITPPAATPDQLWQRVEAAWSAVPQEHSKSLSINAEACGSGVLQQWRLLWLLILAEESVHSYLDMLQNWLMSQLEQDSEDFLLISIMTREAI
ncbi:transposable element Tcb1 transposase [Trichonephila clavipes]|nr:transposable element Tcb1 transposase [Trichonephila clavipes]